MKCKKNIQVIILVIGIFLLSSCNKDNYSYSYSYSNDNKQLPYNVYLLKNQSDTIDKYKNLKTFKVKNEKELLELVKKLKKNKKIKGIVIHKK